MIGWLFIDRQQTLALLHQPSVTRTMSPEDTSMLERWCDKAKRTVTELRRSRSWHPLSSRRRNALVVAGDGIHGHLHTVSTSQIRSR